MEENSLRLMLIIAGIFIVLGIYVYDVFQKRNRVENTEDKESDNAEKIEPTLANQPRVPTVEPTDKPVSNVASEETSANIDEPIDQADIPVADEALVIQLAVLAREGKSMTGAELLNAFTELDLEFGDMGIFHRYERLGGVETKCFHVANRVEPGTFPVGSMGDFESTGIVLFFQANASIDASAAFDSLLIAAISLSESLDAVLVGADMQELTLDGIEIIQGQLNSLTRP